MGDRHENAIDLIGIKHANGHFPEQKVSGLIAENMIRLQKNLLSFHIVSIET